MINQFVSLARAPTARNFVSTFLRLMGTDPMLTPAGSPLMLLGNFVFSLGTVAPVNVTVQRNWRWAEQARLDAAPALQAVGIGSTKHTLEGTVIVPLTRDTEPLAQLQAMADSMQPHNLVDGRGKNLGRFVILETRQTGSKLRADGTARIIEFTIQLQQYQEDGWQNTAPATASA